MATKISEFLATVGQGVKPNMFVVDILWPSGSGATGGDKELIDLLCKSAALPNSTVGVIEVPFRGRTVKIAGDRTFDTWTATFFNDKEFKARSYFEQWMENINTHNGNNAPLFKTNQTEGYMAEIRVKQLEKNDIENGGILREYTLMYAFPASVSSIDLAYDSNDQIEEFSVEFQYSYWTVDTPRTTALTGAAASGIADVRKIIK